MTARRTLARLALTMPAALALSACRADSPLEPVEARMATAPHTAASTTHVPMRGTYEATGTFGTPPATCPGLFSTFAGGGRDSHLGAYTITNDVCTLPVDATHFTFTGSFTKVAASGDLLLGTYTGTTVLVQPPGVGSPIGVFEIAGTLTFTGGTGRFAGTTGTQSLTGTQTTDFSQPALPSSMTLALEGTISTVGSSH